MTLLTFDLSDQNPSDTALCYLRIRICYPHPKLPLPGTACCGNRTYMRTEWKSHRMDLLLFYYSLPLPCLSTVEDGCVE